MGKTLKWLVISSILFLISNIIGTVIAFQKGLTADFGGFLNGQDILKDFLTTNGTALSAPLPFMILQFLFTLLALRMGRVGKVGVAGLVVLGAIYTIAQLGEPILLKLLTPSGFDLAQAIIFAANVVTSILMLVFGIIEWRGRRRQD